MSFRSWLSTPFQARRHLVRPSGGAVRPFFILQGEVSISDLTIANGLAKGGDGGNGAGGGAGMGGGLLIDRTTGATTVTLTNVAFDNNQAVGGTGGFQGGDGGAGGGGGFLGNGGNASGATPAAGGSPARAAGPVATESASVVAAARSEVPGAGGVPAATGAEVFRFQPFEPAFAGGVYVAAGDLDGDGRPELIVTPDEGGGPRVQVYAGAGFGKVADFFGIDDPAFRGGARVAVGDVNGAGDLVVGAGVGGGRRVAVYDGRSVGGAPRKLFGDVFLLEPTLRNGAFVAAGDVDGDGRRPDRGGGARERAARAGAERGRSVSRAGRRGATARQLLRGRPGGPGRGPGRGQGLDGNRFADLVVGDGAGAGSRVAGYFGKAFAGGVSPQGFAFYPFPGQPGGVFVG